MRTLILSIILAFLAALSYLILHETKNLALIKQTTEKAQLTIFDLESFKLPEPKKITNKDKTTTEYFEVKEVIDLFKKSKADYVYYLAYEYEIYLQLITSFSLVALVFTVIGSLVGYWLRSPIDRFDFESLQKESERKIEFAQEQMRKAQEGEKIALEKALRQARSELDQALKQAQEREKQAETERTNAVRAQQLANEKTEQANAERDNAIKEKEQAEQTAKTAENRMKNAQNAALRRKNQIQNQLKPTTSNSSVKPFTDPNA